MCDVLKNQTVYLQGVKYDLSEAELLASDCACQPTWSVDPDLFWWSKPGRKPPAGERYWEFLYRTPRHTFLLVSLDRKDDSLTASYVVSIPLWCDLKPGGPRPGRQDLPKFPSHYGAI